MRTGVVTGGSFTNRTGCQPYYWTMDGNAYCSPEATSDCPTAQCSTQCQQTSQLQYNNDKRKGNSPIFSAQYVNSLQPTLPSRCRSRSRRSWRI